MFALFMAIVGILFMLALPILIWIAWIMPTAFAVSEYFHTHFNQWRTYRDVVDKTQKPERKIALVLKVPVEDAALEVRVNPELVEAILKRSLETIDSLPISTEEKVRLSERFREICETGAPTVNLDLSVIDAQFCEFRNVRRSNRRKRRKHRRWLPEWGTPWVPSPA